jgi:ribonucleotide reductase alpha subunit
MSYTKDQVNMLDEMANFTYTTKYAKYDEKKKRRETWEETVNRIEKMHLKKYNFLDGSDKDDIGRAFDLVRTKKVTPSMRSMQFGGKAIEASNCRMYNCGVRHIDSLRSFAESFYTLLCGTGIGFGITDRFLNRLPKLVNENDKTGTVITYVVQDSIEGWSDSIEALLNCYFKNTPYSGRKIVFDYSKIRPKGAKLKTGGGKAPGYKGLKNCHKKVKELLDDNIENKKFSVLRTIDAYDILMHCADAVLSGGIRRSACSVIFDATDELMMNSKTGNWFKSNPQRARSNNSAIIIRGKTSYSEFKELINKTKEFGEPGFLYVVDENQLLNPCFSIDTKILTTTGWQTFGDLLGHNVNIVQDNRVRGELHGGVETWIIDKSASKCSINLASNIRKTAENQEVFLLTSTCGRHVKATANHSFATSRGMVELKDLRKNDSIFIGLPDVFSSAKNSDSFETGFIAGLVYGDGNIDDVNANVDIWVEKEKEYDTKNIKNIEDIIKRICLDELSNQKTHKKEPSFNQCLETDVFVKYRLSSHALRRKLEKYNFTKNNLKWLHKTDKNFKSGFLSGVFYSDGHIDYNNKSKSVSARITSNQFENLQEIQLICQELGIYSRINDLLPCRNVLLPDGKGGKKLYECKPTFRLIIGGKQNCLNFLNLTTHIQTYKHIRFNEIISTLSSTVFKQKFEAKVKSIKLIGKQDVYCLSEDVNRTLIADGFTARRCFEISFIPITKDGRCGFQMCNLTSINGAKIKTYEDFKEATWAATLIGTLQAGYTDFPYLSGASEELTKEEALLGVSITGMMDNPDVLFNPEYQRNAALYAIEVNKEWAKKININQAARITCIKPEGTNSIVLSAASGIHPHHARKYFRRIQCNKQDNVYQYFKLYNDHACEESVWSENKTDDVITFPIEIPENAMIKSDLTAIQHLEMIKLTQENWVNSGTTDVNKKPLNHSVSCTVVVKDEEWDIVEKYLYENQKYFTAVSLLPFTGDKIYKQAPMEAVITPEDEDRFNQLVKNWTSVNYKKLEEDDDATSHGAEAACAGGNCEVKAL